MKFDEIKARHEKDINEAAEVSARHGQPVIMGQNHADRAWLIAEVERLREKVRNLCGELETVEEEYSRISAQHPFQCRTCGSRWAGYMDAYNCCFHDPAHQSAEGPKE